MIDFKNLEYNELRQLVRKIRDERTIKKTKLDTLDGILREMPFDDITELLTNARLELHNRSEWLNFFKHS